MKKNLYIQPILTTQSVDAENLLASMSTHDEIGDGQLGKETFFEEEVKSDAPKASVWD
jgi:hypothetical protein